MHPGAETNDEAHHVYGEKRVRKGEESEYIKWSKIVERIAKAARLSLVLDLTATPWYGSGSPKPEGTLFEWLVSVRRPKDRRRARFLSLRRPRCHRVHPSRTPGTAWRAVCRPRAATALQAAIGNVYQAPGTHHKQQRGRQHKPSSIPHDRFWTTVDSLP